MRVVVMLIVSLIIIATADAAYAGPGGHIPWAEHTSVVPGWLDPGESDDGNHAIVMIELSVYELKGLL